MKKKDILFLCQFFHPEYISSAQLPFDTARALHQAGFDVGVLCGYPKEYADGAQVPRKETVQGISIRRLRYVQTGRASFFGRVINYFSFTAMVLLHLGELAKYRAVVVYSNPPILPWLAVWAKKLFGCKLVFVAYDLYPEVATTTGVLRPGSLICRVMEHINRRVYPNADGVIALSSEMREYILKNRKIQPGRVKIIPNWYADEGTCLMNRRGNAFRQVTGGRFTVAYFGNMGTMQDMDTILQAMKEMQDEEVFFLFAGHGNKFQKVKDFLEAEQVENAAVYPFLRGADFQDALAISDCALVCLEQGTTGLCVPSKTYSYMMRGLPLIAIMERCDIVRDIESGAGLWVRNGEPQALAQAIRDLRDHPQTREAMARRCREIYVKQYTTEVCTEKYTKFFRELL